MGHNRQRGYKCGSGFRLRPEVWAGLPWRDVLLLRAALAEQKLPISSK